MEKEATAAAGLFCGATVVKLLSTIKQLKQNIAEKQAALEAELARRVEEASGGCGIITTALNWVLTYVWSVLRRVIKAKPSKLIEQINENFKEGFFKYQGQTVDIGECKSRFSQFTMNVTAKGIEMGVALRVIIEPKEFHLVQLHVGVKAFTISSVRFVIRSSVSLTPQTLSVMLTSEDVHVRVAESALLLQVTRFDKIIEKTISDNISESLKTIKGLKHKLNIDKWLVAVVSGEGSVPALFEAVETPVEVVVSEASKSEAVTEAAAVPNAGKPVVPEAAAVPEASKSGVVPEAGKGEVVPQAQESQASEEDILALTQANVEQAVAPVLSDTEVIINKELDERRSACDQNIDTARQVFQKQVKQNKSKKFNKKDYSNLSTATCDDILRNTATLLKDQEEINEKSCNSSSSKYKRIGPLDDLAKKLSDSPLKKEAQNLIEQARSERKTNNLGEITTPTCTALQRAIDTINVRA